MHFIRRFAFALSIAAIGSSVTLPALAADGNIVYSNNSTTSQYRAYTGSTNAFGAETAMVLGAAQTWVVNRAAPTRNEHMAGYVTTGGVLYIYKFDGAAWIEVTNTAAPAGWGVGSRPTVGGNGVDGRRFDIAYENTSGDAMVVYSTGATGTAGNEMAYRKWNGTSWTAATNINSAGFNQAAAVAWIKLKARPTSGSNEIALLAADTGTTTANTSILTSFIWSGAAWTEAGTTHTGSAGATLPNTTGQLMQNECFDQAYESLSGDLLVIFTTASTAQQWRRSYSGGTWGGAASLGTARTTPMVMVAAADPLSNQIICAFNRGGSNNVYAAVWNGTALSAITIVGTSGANPVIEERPLAAGWLTSGGVTVGIVFFGETNANVINYAYTTDFGANWTGATFAITVGNRAFMEADVDPALPDRLMFLVSDVNSDLFPRQIVWNGATFAVNTPTVATLTTTLSNFTTQNFMFAYDRPTTIVGNGAAEPPSVRICPGDPATMLDAFTLQTSQLADTVTAVTVTLAAGTHAGIGLVEITSDTGATVYGSAATPATDTVAITLTTSIPVTTTSTQYKVRITPLAATAMPAPVGASYAVTGTVTAVTDTNPDLFTDTTSATVTIDNLSPANPTAFAGVVHGYGIALSWTNPVDADFSNVVVLRNTVAVTDTPVEGTTYVAGNTIGTSTVVYVGSGTGFIDAGPFTAGVYYSYKIFANDTCVNYSTPGMAAGPFLAKAAIADVSIVKSGSVGSTTVGGTLTYTLVVTNGGPNTASAVNVTDAIPPGMGLNGAVTFTQGSCAGTSVITCNLGAMTSGATATITIPVINNSAGTKSNTASVSDAGIGDYDPNLTNNSSTAVTTVTGAPTVLCATPGKDGPGGVLSTVVNTYYPPGTGTVFAGQANTCIPVGTPTGSSTLVGAGDLLLVIQMQDADINFTNTNNYGGANGTGAGALTVNAGKYEFVKATGPVTAGCIPILGTGANGGLVSGYQNGDATQTKGAMRYQVIRVPQYTTATLGGVTAAPWTTATTATNQYGTGGVLVIDVQGALTVNSGVAATVDGLGFRGGAGRQLTGDVVAPAALDAWANISSTAPNNTAGTVTPAAFTVTAGTNRLLLVAAAAELSAASTLTAFSATYGGVAMHPVATTAAASSQQHAGMWYLLNSEIPAGPVAAAVTYNTGSAATVTGLHIKWASFSGVDQANAISSSSANTNAAATVTFGSQVNYLATNINVFIAANGGTPAGLPGPTGGDLATQAGATVTTSGFSSFIGQSPNEAAAGNYALGTTVTFNGTTSAWSAVVVASLGMGLANTDWRTSSTRTTNGSKGEGMAGTPEWLQDPVTGPFQTNQPFDGYPGGSYARGAPGNAGGGSTDDQPSVNDRNSGGGGGSNGGAGGTGGFSWSTCQVRGGVGAAVTPAITKLVLGGGGGAGTRNNSPGDVLAAGGTAGGGLMVIRAAQLVINAGAILSANGTNAYNGTANDGGGGGGAGGSVIVSVTSGTMSGLAIRARGGTGGDDWLTQPGGGGGGCDGVDADHHGPGGGGGGGVVVYTNTAVAPTIDVSGGAAGRTTTDLNNFGAQPGGVGQILFIGPGSVPGGGSGAECTSDPAISLAHSATTVAPGGTVSVIATVTNAAPFTSTSGLITAVITLGAGLGSPSVTSAPGWSCSISVLTVTCTRSDALSAQISYPAITISATVTATGPATITNNATVANAADVNTANNAATDNLGVSAPTIAALGPVRVLRSPGGTVVSFRTAYEVSNLGFVVMREDGGVSRDLHASLLAGSALFAGQNVTLLAGRRYRFVDREPLGPDTRYFLREIDLTGRIRVHGPYLPESGSDDEPGAPASPTLAALAQATNVVAERPGVGLERRLAAVPVPAASAGIPQSQLADMSAAKISVSREGWYRVTKAALLAAGYDPGTDPRGLRLFAETQEQAIIVNDGGDGSFDAGDSIEFYGYGLDTPATDTRVYWLVSSGQSGLRVATDGGSDSIAMAAPDFPFTTERKDRTVFFAALTTNGDRENFFGPVIGPSGASVMLDTPDVVPDGDMAEAQLQVMLQGATLQEHAVEVALGGAVLGTISGFGTEAPQATFAVPVSSLSGSTAVTLRSLSGSADYSAVDRIRITYPRRYAAEGDLLAFSARAGTQMAVSGFGTPDARIVDVTNPASPVELPVTVSGSGPFTANATIPRNGGRRLLAFTGSQVLVPSAVDANAPSHWGNSSNGAAMVILSEGSLVDSAKALVAARAREGIRAVVVNVTDVYDEFSYGEKDPRAIRSFLLRATKGWSAKPGYVLLLGDASIDPRNYLGFGFTDLVPTKLVPTVMMKTASDDWFVDFQETGAPAISLGRLPARTPDEASAMIGKVLAHDANAKTLGTVLVAADSDGSFDFDGFATSLATKIPAPWSVQRISVTDLGSGMHAALVQDLNAGPAVAVFAGHASEATLGFHTLFDGTDASALTNGARLPIFIGIDCLNGYFHDVYVQSLAESLLKARNGGVAAAWVSSTLTQPDAQAPMMNAFIPLLLSAKTTRLGDAVRLAKPAATDMDVRRSWILLGDPSMRVH